MKNTRALAVDAGISILVCACQRLIAWEHANLAAPFWRLYWNDRSGAAIVLNGKEMKLTPEFCVLIGPDTAYASHLRRPVYHLYIHFLTALSRPNIPFLVKFPAAPLKVALRQLQDNLLRSGMHTPRNAVLAHYLASYALLQMPPEIFHIRPCDSRVAAAIHRLEENLSTPPANAHLAAEAGMNRNSFIRLFRQTTGHAPQQYLTRMRIEQACRLLHCPEISIKEIAAELGFCDRYHFSRVFRKWRGMGPAEFRRRLGGRYHSC